MKLFKRLTAMLVAIMMMFTITGALATEMPVTRMQALLSEGKAIESTTTLNVDIETVGSLLAMMSPPSEDAEAQEQQKAMLGLMLGAINKLKVQAVSTMNNVSGTLGTDAGVLIDFAVSANEETGENTIVTSLLPGYALSMDPEMMKASVQQSAAMQQNPEMIGKLLEKYVKAVIENYEAEVVPSLKSEQGAFDVEGSQYTLNVAGDILAKHVGGMLKAIVAVAKDDAEMKAMVEPMLQQSAASQGETEVKTYDDLIAELSKGAEKMLAEGDMKLFTVNAYKNEESKASLVTVSSPYMDGQAFHVTVNAVPSENGESVKVDLILKSKGEEETEETEINWDETKQNIASGADYSSMVMFFNVDTSKDEAANKATSSFGMNMAVMGMPIALNFTSEENLIGAYESDGTVALSLMAPTPLLTIATKSVETDKQPEAPNTEGTTPFVMQADMDEEAMAPLMQVVMEKGLPKLMENLNTALPEEAAVLLPMLQQMMAAPGTTDSTTQAN